MNKLDHSKEINFQDFRNIPHDVPFDVFYQTLYSDNFSFSGYNFNISSPSPNALLSRDVWIEYTFYLQENADEALRGLYESFGVAIPQAREAFQFTIRQGNVVARSTQEINVSLNQFRIKYEPASYIEMLNRIYVSNTQSQHEFSASGGSFDSGNHGYRGNNIVYYPTGNIIPNGWGLVNAAAALNTHWSIYLHQGFSPAGTFEVAAASDAVANLRPVYPEKYEFINPGLAERADKTAFKLRWDWSTRTTSDAVPGGQFISSLVDAAVDPGPNYWTITIQERLPIPLFKMYTNDGVEGIIPNIQKLTIDALFYTGGKLLYNMFQCNDATRNISLMWRPLPKNNCKCFLKWFMPTIPIPTEISINCPLIDVTRRHFGLTGGSLIGQAGASNTLKYADTALNYKDISFMEIPDVLFVYAHYRRDSYNLATPSDFHLELINFNININASTSKTLGINSVQLYQLWKRNLRHTDANVLGYDEWRKYCFVAVLKPEDYGLKKSTEFNEPVTMSLQCTARNWWINPSINVEAYEAFGLDLYELICVSMYFRNQMIITPTRALCLLK